MSAAMAETISDAIDRAARAFQAPPRIHSFRTKRQMYVYDTNTGAIAGTDALSDSILQHLGRADCGQFLRSRAAEIGEKAVVAALSGIVDMAANHMPRLLSSEGPEEIGFVYCPEAYEDAVANHLQQMVLVLTNACNLDCRYCVYSGKYTGKAPHGTEHMPMDILKASLDYFIMHTRLTEGQPPHLGFYGGESTLVFDKMKYAVAYVKDAFAERPVSVAVTTNFTDITTEMLEFFIREDMRLYVSIDGPKHVHDRYRVRAGGAGTFDAVMANLERLRAIDPEYYYRSVSLSATNVPPYRLDEMKDFFESNEIVRTQPVQITPVSLPSVLFPDCHPDFLMDRSMEQLKREYVLQAVRGDLNDAQNRSPFLSQLFDNAFLFAYRRNRPKGAFPKRMFPGGMCLIGQRRLYVRHDGEIFPCERVPEHEYLHFGSVQRGFDAGKALALYETFSDLTASECRDCWAILLCSGMCVRDILDGVAPSRAKKLQECEKMRRRQSGLLSQMCEILEENPRALDFLNEVTVS